MPKKTSTVALVGVSLAAVAAGAYFNYRRGRWPFNSLPAGTVADLEKKRKPAPVDVALTNEVASYTAHNPSHAADFTDEGATGNAD